MSTETDRPVCVDLRAIGTRVRVELSGCGSGLARAEIERAWSRCLVSDGEPGEPDAVLEAVLDDDPAVVAEAFARGAAAYAELVPLVHEISPRVTDLALRLRAIDDVLLLHAGGVSDAAGRTAVLVGPSGAGKTTAVRRLARRFGYVSDETIAIAPDLSITPYPKPFSVLDREDRWKSQHAPEALGAGPTPAQPQATMILVLDRVAGHEGVDVEELDPLEAIGLLAPQCAFLAARSHPLHRLAALLEAIGPVRRVRYAEADDLAPLLLAWGLSDDDGGRADDVGGRACRDPRIDAPPEPRSPAVEPAETRELPPPPPPPPPSDAPQWRIADAHDVYEHADGRVALLIDDRYLVTSGPAGAIVSAARRDGAVTQAAARMLLERHVEGDAAELTVAEHLLDELVRHGVLALVASV